MLFRDLKKAANPFPYIVSNGKIISENTGKICATYNETIQWSRKNINEEFSGKIMPGMIFSENFLFYQGVFCRRPYKSKDCHVIESYDNRLNIFDGLTLLVFRTFLEISPINWTPAQRMQIMSVVCPD